MAKDLQLSFTDKEITRGAGYRYEPAIEEGRIS